MRREEIFKKLEKAVIDGDPEEAVKAAMTVVETGLDPLDAIEKGFAKGVRIIGDGFGKGELFLMDLMAAAEAMNTGLEILKPIIQNRKEKMRTLGRFLIGTVAGDIHDIGKSITAAMLFANGFEVIDLGVDVPSDIFVKKVKELQPDILGLSAMMSTTMISQKEVIDALNKADVRDNVKVMIGGAIVSQEWAEEIGADAWSKNALEAVEKAKELINKQD